MEGQERATLALDVLADQPLALSEDGARIELLGLEGPLVVGDRFTVSLFFENAGLAKTEVVVRKEEHESRRRRLLSPGGDPSDTDFEGRAERSDAARWGPLASLSPSKELEDKGYESA